MFSMFIFALAYKLRLIVFLYYRYKRITIKGSRSQWPRGVERGSAAAQLLGFRVRIPPVACVFVVCCQVDVSAGGILPSVMCPTSVNAKPHKGPP